MIVGAGPAGLAVAAALRVHDAARFEVLDPSGVWLHGWERQLTAQDVRHLRSPATHHLHPDLFALVSNVREDELEHRGQTVLPTVSGFRRFTAKMIDELDLGGVVTATTATTLSLRSDGRVQLTDADGRHRCPRRVVLATNVRTPQVPAGLRPLAQHPRVRIGPAIDLAQTPPGGHVLVIGGGLSAAHLAAGAVARGAQVTLVARRKLRIRPYDTDVSWMGQWRLRAFEDEPDPQVRRAAIDTARDGGSMPEHVWALLREHERRGALRLVTNKTVVGGQAVGDRLRISLNDGTETLTDEVWSATGTRADVGSDPLLAHLLEQQPTQILGGLPVLDGALRWPETSVHLVGSSAGLVLGPGAGNLFGHRRAAQRIVTFLLAGEPTRVERDTGWTDVIRSATLADPVGA